MVHIATTKNPAITVTLAILTGQTFGLIFYNGRMALYSFWNTLADNASHNNDDRGFVLNHLVYPQITTFLLRAEAVFLAISYIAFHSGYKLGVGAIDTIVGENSKRITDAFNILGVMVVGALAANTIVLKTVAKIPLGGKSQPLQTVLDGIFPGLLPLAMVILGWWLVSSKQMTATKVIIIMVVIVTIGCLIGLF